MKIMNILILGNGPSCLDNPLGEVIDTFDIVVRFNQFKTKTFEKFVGTKTTHWMINSNAETIQYIVDNGSKEIPTEKFDLFLYKSNKLESTIKININKLKKVLPSIEVKTLNKLTYETTEKPWYPSLGIVAINYLIEHYPMISPLVIHGFDTLLGPKECKDFHYFGTVSNISGHNVDKEQKFLEKLISNGKLITLDNFMKEK